MAARSRRAFGIPSSVYGSLQHVGDRHRLGVVHLWYLRVTGQAAGEGMRFTHDARIARADQLAAIYPCVAPLLKFYSELARFPKPVFSELQSKSETDLRVLLCYFPALLRLVSCSGTELLAKFAAENLQNTDAQLELLEATWEGREVLDPAARFYARTQMASIKPLLSVPLAPRRSRLPLAFAGRQILLTLKPRAIQRILSLKRPRLR